MTEVAAPQVPEAPLRTVSFYDELASRRRRGWLYGLACALVAAGQTVALSAFITPVILLVVGGLAHLAGRLGLDPLGARSLARAIHAWASAALDNESAAIDALDKVRGWSDRALVLAPLVRLAPLAAPALAAGGLIWWALRAAYLRGGAVDLATRLAARPANDADAEEHQLANIVEEMAIAAGAPTPRLLVMESPVLNAAAIGHEGEAGTVIVTRGVLDALSRPQTEAIVARLIAAISAGDLRVAQSIMATLRTLGLFLTVLDLPIRLAAWPTLFAASVAMLTPVPTSSQLDSAARRLEQSMASESMPDLDRFKRIPDPIRSLILFPLFLPMLVSMLFKLVLFLWTALFLGPPLALLWRNRCLWTDAAAVRLSRDPESLAEALAKMSESGVPDVAAQQAYLFVGAAGAAVVAASNRKAIGLALSPPIADRIARLVAMGATSWRGRPRPHGGFLSLARHPAGLVVLLAAAAIIAPLFAALVAMLSLLTLLAMELALTAGLMLVKALV